MSAEEARRALASDARAVLVDVEPDGPLPGLPDSTVRWSLDAARAARSPVDVREPLRGKRLLLLCAGGLRSARAAASLARAGVDAVAVAGGWQAWVAAHAPARGVEPSGTALAFFRRTTRVAQAAAVTTFFGVKLAYTVIALTLAVVLWRSRDSALASTRRGMLVFAAGECACAWNVLVMGDRSVLLEHLHSVSMVVSAALVTHALLDGLDARLVRFSDEGRCAALPLCRTCFKHAPVSCGLRWLFLAAVPALAVVAVVPAFSTLRPQAWNTRLFGLPFTYGHPIVHQVYELRFLPAAAVVLLVACGAVLAFAERRPVPVAKWLMSAAVGAMAFSFFRLLLVAAFVDDQAWFGAWEETTELVYVCLVGAILAAFERGLLPELVSSPASAPA